MFLYISQNQLEKTLVRAEEVLNLVGYIPLVSLLSAAVRSFGGMLQIILGLIFATVSFLAKAPSRKSNHFRNCRLSIHHVLHGFFNIVRAKIEAVPFLSLITCLPYDRILKKRFRYSIENRPPEIEIEISG
jgi:hypothetical protein